MKLTYQTENFNPFNNAFLFGDAVKCYFFVKDGQLIMAEECYFFLMASMRKMRMYIPLTYTLEFFQKLIEREIISKSFSDGIITFMAFRAEKEADLSRSNTDFYLEAHPLNNIFEIQKEIEIDLIKEITVNNSLLSSINVHNPENIYAEIYAYENDLDDVILLNPHKRIARCGTGNLLLLTGEKIKIPKQNEGALISPLMENLVTFLHKNKLAEITEDEIIPFETQKAEEILLVSDQKGLFSISKIRNKTFSSDRFSQMLKQWKDSFYTK